MSRQAVNLADISGFVARAFREAARARRDRVAGLTSTTITRLESIRDEAEASPAIARLKETFYGEALVRVYNALGRSYREENRFEEAEKSYRAALEIDPQNELVWYGVAGLYAHLKTVSPQRRPEKTFEEYAHKIAPSSETALLGAGIGYWHAQNEAKARECWTGVLKENNNNVSARFLLAKSHYVVGEDGMACAYLRPVIQNVHSPECMALYLAAAEKNDTFAAQIRLHAPEIIDNLELMAASFQRDHQKIWAMQQAMRMEQALSDGVFQTVWRVSERLGLHPRPVNEGAKAGATHIRRAPA